MLPIGCSDSQWCPRWSYILWTLKIQKEPAGKSKFLLKVTRTQVSWWQYSPDYLDYHHLLRTENSLLLGEILAIFCFWEFIMLIGKSYGITGGQERLNWFTFYGQEASDLGKNGKAMELESHREGKSVVEHSISLLGLLECSTTD